MEISKINGSMRMHLYPEEEFPNKFKIIQFGKVDYRAFLGVENCSKHHNSAERYGTAAR
jgi:hypothetical protein